MGFTSEQLVRYSRNMLVREIGGSGQQRLRQARALIVGAGGLGGPAALYLAGAGVGTLGIVDDDAVELSNLQRQILHRTADVGVPKVESARRAVAALNPDVQVKTHPVRLDVDNALELVLQYDVVVGGVDNFATRYALNDACVVAQKPLVEASIVGWTGMIMTVRPGGGPCYRCLFPEAPPAGAVQSCQEAGVVGPLAGLIGALQAVEAIKVLLDVGQSLTGRLLLIDGLAASFKEMKAGQNPACSVCAAPAVPAGASS